MSEEILKEKEKVDVPTGKFAKTMSKIKVLKAANKNISNLKAKMKAAEKRSKTARKNGSEKQILKCDTQYNTSKKQYEKAKDAMKETNPPSKAKVITTWAGLVTSVVALISVGVFIFLQETSNGDNAAKDKV